MKCCIIILYSDYYKTLKYSSSWIENPGVRLFELPSSSFPWFSHVTSFFWHTEVYLPVYRALIVQKRVIPHDHRNTYVVTEGDVGMSSSPLAIIWNGYLSIDRLNHYTPGGGHVATVTTDSDSQQRLKSRAVRSFILSSVTATRMLVL